MPAYVAPTVRQRFSSYYLQTAGSASANSPMATNANLLMDINLPQGFVQWNYLLNDSGTGTTNATPGTTTSITHKLGFVPNNIQLTSSSNGFVYLDAANPATATTFHVLGSAASLNFSWLVQ